MALPKLWIATGQAMLPERSRSHTARSDGPAVSPKISGSKENRAPS